MNYYNDHEPYAAKWLENLIAAGLLPLGDVDSRDIQEVTAHDLSGYTQCHFYAGIGGWSLALQLAQWPTARPVWTGSCPCQPFSVAGKGKGVDDHRHIWPEFKRLIAECSPPVVFGEQVASKDGRKWLSGVRLDLEALGYGVGSADLCAAGVGAPHIRQRLWWVADSNEQHDDRRGYSPSNDSRERGDQEQILGVQTFPSRMGDTTLSERARFGFGVQEHISGPANYWADSITIPCGDGKTRRIKPGLAPLVDGLPGRVGLIRGYGNAICPEVGAEFISAFLAARP